MTDDAGPYKGADRYEARERVIRDLARDGFLEKTEAYTLSVGTCQRCKTVVEPDFPHLPVQLPCGDTLKGLRAAHLTACPVGAGTQGRRTTPPGYMETDCSHGTGNDSGLVQQCGNGSFAVNP